MSEAHFKRIESLFESFSPSDVEQLGLYYTESARFKDPFNEVEGLAAVQRVYRHMFDSLVRPRFVITDRMVLGDQCWLVWEFRFEFQSILKGQPQTVHGASRLGLAADGRIQTHRDYWDAAEEIYAKLPGFGAVMRWLQRRMGGAAA